MAQTDSSPRLIISPATLNVTEGEEATYWVVLDKSPVEIGDVDGGGADDFECGDTAWVKISNDPDIVLSETVTLSPHGTQLKGGGMGCSGGNWNIRQEIIVTAADDEVDTNEIKTVTLTHEVVNNAGTILMETAETPTVTVNIYDDDVTGPGVSITPPGGRISEGKKVVFTLTRTGTTAELGRAADGQRERVGNRGHAERRRLEDGGVCRR